MKNVIDLSPYLSKPSDCLPPVRRRRRFGSIAAFFESVVTLVIGALCTLVLLSLLLAL